MQAARQHVHDQTAPAIAARFMAARARFCKPNLVAPILCLYMFYFHKRPIFGDKDTSGVENARAMPDECRAAHRGTDGY